MLYLNDEHIAAIRTDWSALIDVIRQAVYCVDKGDFAQPLKPYLRYRNPKNRIIAMPAFVGGPFESAGIKWIASFPENLKRGLPRAHSVVVLNDADTGVPVSVINTPRLSVLRTAAVSGLVMESAASSRYTKLFNLAIIGWGPIGQAHFQMMTSCFGDRIQKILLHDVKRLNKGSIEADFGPKVFIADTWQEAYEQADVIVTCTVASSRYITRPPKPGALLLHVSLRDYVPEALNTVRAIIVDDWEEVCREQTDIELLHKEYGLSKAQTRSIADVVCRRAMAEWGPDEPVLFCPMGLSVFDIAMGSHYAGLARQKGLGQELL
ncbi:2,3-diaminopropionate biosynthesis protein SbnB [Paenibacillus contaminans]|uniref:2,3-diaminopropionate biosynthesis protein SbnB n=1 Tax=Paenibacillus contaminans TaxID=450362 RepID=UPI001EDEB3ED|nr:2,3-diaminopropionate biosynthesis protein SbnB [Paenibacillus contaminans]